MKKYDFLSGLFLLLLSIGTCIMAYRLGFGNISTPGPGLIAFGTAAILGLMSIGMVLSNLFGMIRAHQQKKVFQGIRWKILLLVLCSLVGYGMAFNTLGFNLCTFLLMLLLLKIVGLKKWWLVLSFSVLVAVATYFLFVGLGCEFPRGFLGV